MHKKFLLIFIFLMTGLMGDDIPVNTWKPLGDGNYPPPKGSWPNLTGPAFYWIRELDFGLIAPILTETEGKEGPGYRKISFESPQWEFVPGKIPQGLVPDMWGSPKGYVYLPSLKKILFLKQEWSYSSKKQPVASWLLSLEDATWEPIIENFSMSDKSIDFNRVATLDGCRSPIWGTLCYDAHNKEAVSFGGGGVWGRVGAEKESVKTGDWIFDESVKTVRRLTIDDEKKITTARRWYPGHCGTWVFSEAEKKWKATEQALGAQPGSRILPGMAFDANQKKIVLFGGDNLTKCLNDTWVYDSATRIWSQAKPAVSPPARAGHAMVYIPEQKVLLMMGGYSAYWQPLKDVWAYDTEKGEWSKIGFDLPGPSGHASADFDPKRGLVMLASYAGTRGNKKIQVYALKFDFANAPKVPAPEPIADRLNYHCSGKNMGAKLPDELLIGDLAVKDETAGIKSISEQPANTWVLRKPPYIPPGRDWGSNIYDVRTHRGYSWGGGHSTYPGADVIEYIVGYDRWVGMVDAPNYNPSWLHGMVGGPPGVSFGGWSLLPTHSRKSYGIDVLSNSMITYVGDVYDLKHRMFIGNIGICPGKYGVATQVSFCTTPHGLYGYSTNLLAKADVANGKWESFATGGPKHDEHGHLCYDSKRNKLVYFERDTLKISTFDFASKQWQEEQVNGKSPLKLPGDSTYIPELDAALLILADDKKNPELMYFYKLEEKKWYSAPYQGDKFAFQNTSGRDFSPVYDPKLKAIVRIKNCNRMEVAIMRLDVATLTLTPLE